MSKQGVEPTILEKLVKHNDSTMGSMVSRELMTKLSQEQRVALAGEVARARYKDKNSLTEVYRNAAYIANPLIMQIVQDNGYPVGKDKLDEFFRLGQQANQGSQEAKNSLKKYLDNVPTPVIQTLLPMYHEIVDDANNETKESAIKKIVGIGKERKIAILQKLGIETKDIPDEKVNEKITEVLSKMSETEVKQIRLNEAKIAFMGSVAFAFVEQQAFEMENRQDAQKLQAQFRELRDKEPEMMSGLIQGLDKANEEYVPPRKLDKEVEKTVNEVYTKAEKEVKEVKESNKSLEQQVKVTERALNDLCIEIKKNVSEDEVKELEDIRSECGNIFSNLNVAIGLKGQKITDEDVSQKIKSVVNLPVNGRSLLSYAVEQNNINGVKLLLDSGANSLESTANYKRSIGQAFKDGFKDFPKKLKDLFKKPERTIEDIAKIQGRNDIVEMIQHAKLEQEIPHKTVDSELLKNLNSAIKETRKNSVLVDLGAEGPSKGLFSKKKTVDKKKKQKEPTLENPIQIQIKAIDQRLEEMKTKENYQLPPEHPHKKAMDMEEKLLTGVRAELSKDPIDREAINDLIDKGLKEIAEYAQFDSAGRDLPVETKLMIEDIREAIEPPRSSVGVKSGGK
ncbi:MAG: ankyrin repeat domain-containing protein [Candidatus Berkiella sp.]